MLELRREFPVFERRAYLNAGSSGPVPRRAVEAVAESLRAQAEDGRGDGVFFGALMERIDALRDRAATLLGCDSGEVAITGATTDGANAVLSGLDLRAGDEVVTSDEEHPGLLAPLGRARRRGVEVRVAPFAALADAVGPRTRLVACSHVSWLTGQVVDAAALADADALVLLDGAQGLGAVPTDVRTLGCDFYAASGQKWLCGPNGSGYLYVRGEVVAELDAPWPGYGSVDDPTRALEYELHAEARRLDVGFPAPHQVAWALAALDVLAEHGLDTLQRRAVELAAGLAVRLTEQGRRVAPRGDSTLVSWEADDPVGTVERCLAADVVVRNLPSTPYVRASVGGWTNEEDLERLLLAAC